MLKLQAIFFRSLFRQFSSWSGFWKCKVFSRVTASSVCCLVLSALMDWRMPINMDWKRGNQNEYNSKGVVSKHESLLISLDSLKEHAAKTALHHWFYCEIQITRADYTVIGHRTSETGLLHSWILYMYM